MVFNESKCSIIHFGHNSQHATYTMNGTELESVTSEKDLGVLISDKLKPSLHCAESAKRANRMLECINRNIVLKRKDIVVRLYKQLLRPHLEYAVHAWSPNLVKDIQILEKVQRRATRLIPEIRDKPYPERLKLLKLTSLQLRRHHGDMIDVF